MGTDMGTDSTETGTETGTGTGTGSDRTRPSYRYYPVTPSDGSKGLPGLPPRAAYLRIDNALGVTSYSSRNVNTLVTRTLTSLRQQLIEFNTPPGEDEALLLPDFHPAVLDNPFDGMSLALRQEYSWLGISEEWARRRKELPKVLILHGSGPRFNLGYDLHDVNHLTARETLDAHKLASEVASLIRRSPIPVIGMIHAGAFGLSAQLALSTDLPIATAPTTFQLRALGVRSPSPSLWPSLSRRLGDAFAYRMFALGQTVRADQLPVGAIQTVSDKAALEAKVMSMTNRLVRDSAQLQAVAKWTFWTQVGPQGIDQGKPDTYSVRAVRRDRAVAAYSSEEAIDKTILRRVIPRRTNTAMSQMPTRLRRTLRRLPVRT
ncbi:ClpP/crotonase-like domain-containing protein [Nemania sp. FL0916]|nr:ClpP/crotonase-like domain-containing protein [Nemania sp. FL0916]